MAKKNRAVRVSEALDVPLDAVCDLPRIELVGSSELNVENLRGILDYDENSLKLNTRAGIIKVDGSDLVLTSVTDENVCVTGSIIRIEFI